MRGSRSTALALALVFAFASLSAFAASVPAAPSVSGAQAPSGSLAGRLESIREKVMSLETALIRGLRSQKEAQANVRKIRELMALQREERAIAMKRIQELQDTVAELQKRRGILRERIVVHQRQIRGDLIDLSKSLGEAPQDITADALDAAKVQQHESEKGARRRVLAALVKKNLAEIEALKIDLADADQLEAKIEEEHGQLVYLLQDLRERESIMELNRQLQADLLKQNYEERLSQLENYKKLKGAEARVEKMIGQFNARKELQSTQREEIRSNSEFAKLKGRLPLPLAGKILSNFGKALDPASNLQVFNKGIDISTQPGKKLPVTAISKGKVAYSGELPNYGKIAILDHGDHFYSLCANLGELKLKTGDFVAAGDPIGSTDDSGKPVYFEIRSRNIALNPLQWVSN